MTEEEAVAELVDEVVAADSRVLQGKPREAYNCQYYQLNKHKYTDGTFKKAALESYSRQHDALRELREGKTCAHCPHDQARRLEFDHLDPTKTISVRDGYQKHCKAEGGSSQVSVDVHLVSPRQDGSRTTSASYSEGVFARYRRRVCHGPLCQGQIRANEHFYHRKGKPSGCCKTCRLVRQQQIKIKQTAYVRKLKRNVLKKCQICPREVEAGFEMCFDFDHIDQSTKKNDISAMVCNGASKKTLDAEIAKCRLLCSSARVSLLRCEEDEHERYN
jgi:hypothetical protein